MRVSDLLADDSLRLTLATPSSGDILDSPVKSVVSTESLSPTGFLEPDTLLLTTGQSMRFENEQIWLAYVERLKDARVSALAFSIGIVHPELPRNLGKAATSVGLPVLVVPPEVSALQLQQSINRSLSAERYWLSRRAWSVATHCMSVATRQGGIDELLGKISEFGKVDVAIYDDSGHYFAGPFRPSDELESSAEEDVDVLGLPLDEEFEWKLVAPKGSSDDTAVLLGPAATVISMTLARQFESPTGEFGDLLDRFALDLLSDAPDATSSVREGLKALGLDPRRPIGMMRAEGSSKVRRNLLAHRLQRLLTRDHRVSLIPYRNSSVLLYQPTNPSNDSDTAELDSNVCEDSVSSNAGDGLLIWRTLRSVDEVMLAYRQVLSATVAPGLSRASQPDTLDVASLIPPHMRKALATTVLDRIAMTRDGERHLATLRALLTTESLAQAATMLNVHRNTLRKDIARLEQAAGASLNTPSDLAPFAVALQILDM